MESQDQFMKFLLAITIRLSNSYDMFLYKINRVPRIGCSIYFSITHNLLLFIPHYYA
jgi:hypothetical protein